MQYRRDAVSEDAKDVTGTEGGCLCGSVRFRFEYPSRFCVHCHCSICRRAHGAGFVTWAGVPRAHFAPLGSRAHLTTYKSSDHGIRTFCGNCGSSLFCESNREPDLVYVAIANLDRALDRIPQAHVYFSDRADWIDPTDALPRLGGASGDEPL